MMLTAEKTTDSMGSMMKNQFFGDVSHSSDDPKECAMMGLIRNQKIDLEDRLNDAKLKFADANLVKDNWSCAKEREIDCKVLEGQIFILSKNRTRLRRYAYPCKNASRLKFTRGRNGRLC